MRARPHQPPRYRPARLQRQLWTRHRLASSSSRQQAAKTSHLPAPQLVPTPPLHQPHPRSTQAPPSHPTPSKHPLTTPPYLSVPDQRRMRRQLRLRRWPKLRLSRPRRSSGLRRARRLPARHTALPRQRQICSSVKAAGRQSRAASVATVRRPPHPLIHRPNNHPQLPCAPQAPRMAASHSEY